MPDPFDDSPCQDKYYGSPLVGRGTGIPAAQRFLRYSIGLLPVLGPIQGGMEAITGCDLGGNSLGPIDRALGGVGAALPLLHGIGGVVGTVGEVVGDIGAVERYENHHLLPRDFEHQFGEVGIGNIHLPEFLVPLERNYHQDIVHGMPDAGGVWRNNGRGGLWNDEWKWFFDHTEKPTEEMVREQLRRMRDGWGF